jgi:hypothetical protein
VNSTGDNGRGLSKGHLARELIEANKRTPHFEDDQIEQRVSANLKRPHKTKRKEPHDES